MASHEDFRKNLTSEISGVVGSPHLLKIMADYYNKKEFWPKFKDVIDELTSDNPEKKAEVHQLLSKYADSLRIVRDEVIKTFDKEHNSLVEIMDSYNVTLKTKTPSTTAKEPTEIKKTQSLDALLGISKEKNEMIGKILDDTFEIVSLISEGGEATLYKAKIISHQKYMDDKEVGVNDLVAIREYKKPGENVKKSIKALSESKSKKNIVKYIYNFDKDGIKYVVTEFIDGRDLESINKRLLRNFTPEEAAIIAYSTGIALKDVHDSGIIHCDVNGRNIMIAKNGEQKLIDFGLIHYFSEGKRKKSVGSVHYFSPQQIIGDIDYRTDIYAIGPMLFELLTGRKLFDDNEQDIEKRIKNIEEKIMKGVKPSSVKDCLCDLNSHRTEDTFVYELILKSLETGKVRNNKKIPVTEELGFRNVDEFLAFCRKALKNYNIQYVIGESNPEEPALEIPLPEPAILYDLKNIWRRKIMNEITMPGERWNP